MSSKEDIIQTLCYLGLEKIDAIAYTSLLQSGPITIRNLSDALEVDRGSAYRSIGRLRNLGLVSTTLSNPTTCSPTVPKEALNTILQRKRDEIVTMQKISKQIEKNLLDIQRPPQALQASSFSVIQGRPNIYSWLGKLIQKSTGMVFIVTTVSDATLMYHTSIPEKIKKCKKAGGKVLLLTEKLDGKLPDMIFKLGADEVRVGKLPSKTRMFVEDGKHLIMSDFVRDAGGLSEKTDYVFYTNSHEMSSNLYTFCKQLWEASEPPGKSGKSKSLLKNKTKLEQVDYSHKHKELEQEKLILKEMNNYFEEKLKEHKLESSHKFKQLENEKVLLENLNKLLEKKIKKKSNHS